MKDAGPSRGRRQWRQGRGNGVGGNGEQRGGRRRSGRGRGRGQNGGYGRGGQAGSANDRLPPTDGDSFSILGFRRANGNGQSQRDESASARGDQPPDGFELFCAYHLGITIDERYQKPSLTEVARRFNVSPEELKTLLVQFRIDKETIEKSDFDLQGAQLDIRVAPEGISRREIARDHYEEYLQQIGA